MYIYSKRVNKTRLIESANSSFFLFYTAARSSGLYWILLFLLAIMRTIQEPPKSSVGQPSSQYTCSWCPRVCQPVFSQCPGCMMCDTVARLPQLCLLPSPHIAKLSAGPSLVRARAASPVPELCSFLSGPGAANMTGRHKQTQPVSHNPRPRLITSNITVNNNNNSSAPHRNNSSCGNKIRAKSRLDVSCGLSSRGDICGCLFFASRIFFAYNKYFPERAMISRLTARSFVSAYTDWVFIEMWSMTNPFSSILATSPEPGLFRPLKWWPSSQGKSSGN